MIDFVGLVKDELGNPLIGANVVSLTGQKRGVITDFNGVFRLRESAGENFQVSFIGYKPFRFVVASGTSETRPLQIVMQEDVLELAGVTVTAPSPVDPTPFPRLDPLNLPSDQLRAFANAQAQANQGLSSIKIDTKTARNMGFIGLLAAALVTIKTTGV